jgi:AraC-like DNA-binding protein
MITTIRGYLGKSWMPSWVEVDYPRDASAGVIKDRLGVPIHFGRLGVGVAIERAAFISNIGPIETSKRQVTMSDVIASTNHQRTNSSMEAIRDIISLRLLDGHTDIDGVALLAGVGPRTLQRQLSSLGSSYRDLLDAARLRRALGMLRETSEPIVNISVLLGYSEHGNFTRAFRRWTGRSPTDCRINTDHTSD